MVSGAVPENNTEDRLNRQYRSDTQLLGNKRKVNGESIYNQGGSILLTWAVFCGRS